jgi:hypothetical protein
MAFVAGQPQSLSGLPCNSGFTLALPLVRFILSASENSRD